MPHIHDLIDWTVTAFIVHTDRVLLVHHTALQKWLPVGGHIELHEDPEQALLRIVQKEAGIEFDLLSPRSEVPVSGGRMLPTPNYMDIHAISDTHKHIALGYYARGLSDQVTLEKDAHSEIKWFTREELNDPKFDLLPNIRINCEEALDKVAATL
ncbi:MAG TPA: NUDIX domain-containing protein [Patescibacteria group bacterium]